MPRFMVIKINIRDIKITQSSVYNFEFDVKKGRKMVAKVLIENGADVNARRNDGSSPLHRTIEMGMK